MKELNEAKKAFLLGVVIVIILVFVLFYVFESFGCFGCNMCGDGLVWSCFQSCTKCICS